VLYNVYAMTASTGTGFWNSNWNFSCQGAWELPSWYANFSLLAGVSRLIEERKFKDFLLKIMDALKRWIGLLFEQFQWLQQPVFCYLPWAAEHHQKLSFPLITFTLPHVGQRHLRVPVDDLKLVSHLGGIGRNASNDDGTGKKILITHFYILIYLILEKIKNVSISFQFVAL
jgi:hypothetical protein